MKPVSPGAARTRRTNRLNRDDMITAQQMSAWTEHFCTGQLQYEILQDKRPRSVVVRLKPCDAETVIAKFWNRPGLRGMLRRLTRTDPVSKEVRTLRRFRRSRVRVPKVLGHWQVNDRSLPYTGALFLEDLGECILAMEHVKTLILDGKEDELHEFEEQLIDITWNVLAAGIVDTDHTLINMVVNSSMELYRLDYEVGKKVLFRGLVPRAYGDMLGRMLESYTYAVQPDAARTYRFAKRLVDVLRPPPSVLKRVSAYVDRAMDEQHSAMGIKTEVTLPW